MDEKKEEKIRTYSWGPLYETLREMIENGDELPDEGLKKGFELFHRLDEAKSIKEVGGILKEFPLTKTEQLRLNSPCLDGIIECMKTQEPVSHAAAARNSDTYIYFMALTLTLTSQQQLVLDDFLKGMNLKITGYGGTGKSYLIEAMRLACPPDKVMAITTTTGVSAINIGGTTLHSYFGLGLARGDTEDLLENIRRNSKAMTHWRQTDILIIDEDSMLAPELFDKLEEIACIMRNGNKQPSILNPSANEPEKPFGGMQVIMCGDFLQLPVVNNDGFCFEAKSWNKVIQKTHYLKELIRQKDPDFQQLQIEARMGHENLSKKSKELLISRLNVELTNDLGIEPTYLFSTNNAVDQYNEAKLNELCEEGVEFHEYNLDVQFHPASGGVRQEALERILKNAPAPSKLQICPRAQVMLLANLDVQGGLANGSRGVVTEFVEGYPMVRFLNGKEVQIQWHSWETKKKVGKKWVTEISISQIPLRVCFACSIHKSQSATLDYVVADLGSSIFEYGQAYVALSRVRTLEGLSLSALDFRKIKAHPKCLEYYRKLDEEAEKEENN